MTAAPLVAKTGIGFGDETLSVYDEGTWVPTLPNGGTLSVVNAQYVKVGKSVTCNIYVNNVAPTNNASIFAISLPFAPSTQYTGAGALSYSGTTPMGTWKPLIDQGTGSFIHFFELGNSSAKTNANYVALGGTFNMVLAISYISAT